MKIEVTENAVMGLVNLMGKEAAINELISAWKTMLEEAIESVEQE